MAKDIAKDAAVDAVAKKNERARIISVKSEIGLDSILVMENATVDDAIIYTADTLIRLVKLVEGSTADMDRDTVINAVVDLANKVLDGSEKSEETPTVEPVDVHKG